MSVEREKGTRGSELASSLSAPLLSLHLRSLPTPYGRSLATRVTVPFGHFGLRRDGTENKGAVSLDSKVLCYP